jgi:hypothetical protein
LHTFAGLSTAATEADAGPGHTSGNSSTSDASNFSFFPARRIYRVAVAVFLFPFAFGNLFVACAWRFDGAGANQ